MCWRQARAGEAVGAVAAVAGEDHQVAEAAGGGRTKSDRHQPGLASRQAEGTASADAEGNRSGSGACERLAASVNKLERLGAALADDHRPEIEIGRTQGQLRRRIGHHNIVGAALSVRSNQASDRQNHRVGARDAISMRQTRGAGVRGGPVTPIPEAVGDRARGCVSEVDCQRLQTRGGATNEAGYRHGSRRASKAVGAVAAVACRERGVIRKAARARRGELEHDIGRAKTSQAERRARQDRERTSTHSYTAVG